MRRLFTAVIVAAFAGSVHAASVDDAQLEHWLRAAERELAQAPAGDAARGLRLQIAMHRLDRRAARRTKGEGATLAHLKGDDRDKARALAAMLRQQADDDEGAADIAARIESDSNRNKTWAALCVRSASQARMTAARACFEQLTNADVRSETSDGVAQYLAFRGDLAEADVWAKGIEDRKARADYEELRRVVAMASASLEEVAAALREEKVTPARITFANPGFDSKLRFCVRTHAREKAAAGDVVGARALIGVCPAGEAQARGFLAVGDGQLRAGDKSGAAATAQLARAQAESLPRDHVFRPILLAWIARLFQESDRLDAAEETARSAWAAEMEFGGGAGESSNSLARQVIVEVLVQSGQLGRAATAAGSGQDETFVLACARQFVRTGRADQIEGFLQTVDGPLLRAAAWLKAAGEITTREWQRPVVSTGH